ncbi:hypothetical protein GQ54DRAFT_336699 [Martensiomyces pterosporus]|nr:hypothetical protein GQ54DRAFT_336699 [Martensiomyces pterosporus]
MRSAQIASLLAVALSTLCASSSPVSTHASVKPFHPTLKNKGPFVVYETPVAIHFDEYASSAAFVGPASTDGDLNPISTIAVAFLNTMYDIPISNIKVTDAYIDSASGITHVYMVQSIGGVDIANAVANVNIDKDKRIISSSHSFAPAPSILKVASSSDNSGDLQARASGDEDMAKNALVILATYIGVPLSDADVQDAVASVISSETTGQPIVTIDGLPTDLSPDGTAIADKAFIQQEDGEVVPVWRVNVEQQNHWWNAHIDVLSQKVLSLNDWYANSESYYVYPRNVLSPEDGLRKLVVDPADKTASPQGWVTKGSTYGNNVWAQSNPTGGTTWQNNHRPSAAAGNVFNFAIDFTKSPPYYVDAAITQLFYTVNLMHDLSYIYGFDEAAGNFQDINYSGKGVGGDGVIASAQDGSGTDNANFATPPDGQRPRMRMYIWTETTPNRDGDLEQDIVAHEFTHGISNRLTGGPSNTDCLNSGEPGGMGEGWSDAVSYILRLNASDTHNTDFILGKYVYTKSIRTYPYSTSLATNPETYGYLDKPDYQEVHQIGEVWAEILYEVLWALIDKNGFASDTSYQGSDRNSTVDYADADSLNGTLDTAVGNDHAKQALKTAGSGGSAHDALGYLYDNSTRHLGTGTQTNFCVQ